MRSGRQIQLKHLAWFQVRELDAPPLGNTTWNLEEIVVVASTTKLSMMASLRRGSPSDKL